MSSARTSSSRRFSSHSTRPPPPPAPVVLHLQLGERQAGADHAQASAGLQWRLGATVRQGDGSLRSWGARPVVLGIRDPGEV